MLSNSERRRFDEIVRQLEQEAGAGAGVTPTGFPASGTPQPDPSARRARPLPGRRDAVWLVLVVLGLVGTVAGVLTLQLTVLLALGLLPLAAAAWLRARARQAHPPPDPAGP